MKSGAFSKIEGMVKSAVSQNGNGGLELDTVNGDGNGGSADAQDYITKAYREYGQFVLTDRAIPAVQDGLKPVQRRILYAIYTIGGRANANTKKCATIVGETMGKYHPHGDASIYAALVNMTNPEPMYPGDNHPFSSIDPQGNFGMTPRHRFPPASMRYTEARLSKLGMYHFECMDVAEMEDNYNGEEREPRLLPTRLPNLLLMGTMGLAVGTSTNIPRHNLKDIVRAVKLLIDNPEVSYAKLVRAIRGPDFGHSSILSPAEDIMNMYQTGKGTIRYCCDYHVNRGKGRHELVVTSYAPGFSYDSFVKLLNRLVDEKKILSFNDETNKSPRISIEFKDPVVIEEYVLPALSCSEHYQWEVIDMESPEPKFLRVDLMSCLSMWIDYRRKIETQMLELEKSKNLEALSREFARLAGIQNVEELARILSNRKALYGEKVLQIKRKVKVTWASKTRDLTDSQIEFLLDLKIRSLDSLHLDQQKRTINGIFKEIRRIDADLKDVDTVIKRHLDRLESTAANTLKKWTPTKIGATISPLDLQDSTGEETGYWCIDRKGFARAFDKLPQRKGKWVRDSFTVRATETITIVEAGGMAYNVKSVLLTHGRTRYRDVVGVVSSSCPILVVCDNKGNVGIVQHPMKRDGVVMKMEQGNHLIGAWGVCPSDNILAFIDKNRYDVKQVVKLKTKRPGSAGIKLIRACRKAPTIFVIPKSGALVANGIGSVEPEDITPSTAAFAVGRSNWVVTVNNDKRIAGVAETTSIAMDTGISHISLLR